MGLNNTANWSYRLECLAGAIAVAYQAHLFHGGAIHLAAAGQAAVKDQARAQTTPALWPALGVGQS